MFYIHNCITKFVKNLNIFKKFIKKRKMFIFIWRIEKLCVTLR